MNKKECLSNLNNGARLICLAILSGGAAMVTVVAVTLVKNAIAVEQITTAEAAFRNGPAFVKYGQIAMIVASVLFVTELGDIMMRHHDTNRWAKRMIMRYASSLACIVAMFTFNLGFAKPMEKLMPEIRTNEAAHAEFDTLHQCSRVVFGIGILFGFVSLVIPSVALGPCKPEGQE